VTGREEREAERRERGGEEREREVERESESESESERERERERELDPLRNQNADLAVLLSSFLSLSLATSRQDLYEEFSDAAKVTTLRFLGRG